MCGTALSREKNVFHREREANDARSKEFLDLAPMLEYFRICIS
jgi:hypothetical protein